MKIVWSRSIGWNMEISKMNGRMIADGAGTYPWTEVFAYWPVSTINGKRIWWQKVWKRRIWIAWGSGFHMEPEVQYGTAFDMINDPWQVEYDPTFHKPKIKVSKWKSFTTLSGK